MPRKSKKSGLNFQEIHNKNNANKKAFDKIRKYQNLFNQLQASTKFALEVLEHAILDKNGTLDKGHNKFKDASLSFDEKNLLMFFQKPLNN